MSVLDVSSIIMNNSSVANAFVYSRIIATFKRFRQLLYSLNYLISVLGRGKENLIEFIDHIRTYTLDSYRTLIKAI